MTDDGWIVHQGKGCPVPLDSKPGVRFRSHEESKPGVFSASEWVFYRESQNLWVFDRHGPADIIAYKPESEGAL